MMTRTGLEVLKDGRRDHCSADEYDMAEFYVHFCGNSADKESTFVVCCLLLMFTKRSVVKWDANVGHRMHTVDLDSLVFILRLNLLSDRNFCRAKNSYL